MGVHFQSGVAFFFWTCKVKWKRKKKSELSPRWAGFLNLANSRCNLVVNGRGFLALGCKCSLYFKCNLNIFLIIKKIREKMLHVHLHNLCMSLVASHKSDSSRGLGKIRWYKKGLHATFFYLFLLTTLRISIYRETWLCVRSLSRCTREIFVHFF
jgi:hypothetical protein